jgi:type III pantothenate kinase
VVRPGVRTGIRILADNPSEVGADLVVNAVAAYERFRDACIVVSLGTATVFTAISAKGDFLGASIAPGLKMAAWALAEKTAQLPGIQLVAPPAAIGRNTIHAMQSGLILGYVSMVEGMAARFRRELGSSAHVIATGGLAGLISPHTEVIEVVEPWLTLEGLKILAERNLEER